MRVFSSFRTPAPELDHLLAASRRFDGLQDMLRRMRTEMLPERVMEIGLHALSGAMGSDGAAVISDAGAVLFQADAFPEQALAAAAALVLRDSAAGSHLGEVADRGGAVLVCRIAARLGEASGIALWRKKGPWEDADCSLAEAGANLLALVLEQQAVQQEMARQSRTDHLTGLFNRRAFYDELERHFDRLEREQLPGTLILADLDGFRTVNERLGFIAGDRALQTVARLLRAAVRPTDVVARIGGDDFAVWLNGADHLTAAERAEYLRQAIPLKLAKELAGQSMTITVSMGIATRPAGSGSPPGEVIERAEHALRLVKQEGRGNWRVAQAEAV